MRPWPLLALGLGAISFFGVLPALAEVRPVNRILLDVVKSKPPKRVYSLANAQELLRQKRYVAALKWVAPVKNDVEYGDYAYWIAGHARIRLAETLPRGKKNLEPLTKAVREAISEWHQIEIEWPYSALIDELPKEIAAGELLLGEAYAKANRWSQSLRWLENGFQRLQSSGLLGRIKPETLKAYAQACSKVSSPLCSAWIQRFSLLYNRNSIENRTLGELFPAVASPERAQTVERKSRPYKATNNDGVAFSIVQELYELENFGAVPGGFSRFLERFPKTPYRNRANFLSALALDRKNERQSALALWETIEHESPLTFYGLASSLLSRIPIEGRFQAAYPEVADRDTQLLPQELLGVRRAEAFLAAGTPALASLELQDFAVRAQLSTPFLEYLAILPHYAGNHRQAFQLISEVIQRGSQMPYSSLGVRMVFPLRYLELIRARAQESGIDPLLVLSLVKQESAFDPEASSSVGAQGLMQLMPSTASDVSPGVARVDLINPEINVQVGTLYLKSLLTRYEGNMILALAAYNAGPGAVDRWIREPAARKGAIEFLESIPYLETREYVQSIIRNYYWYGKRMGVTLSEPFLSYFWNDGGVPSARRPITK